MKCALMPVLRCNKILVVAAVCFVITVSTYTSSTIQDDRVKTANRHDVYIYYEYGMTYDAIYA